MAGFSNYMQNNILNWVKGTNMPTAPTTVYVGLHTADPLDDDTGGGEVTTTIRAAGRVAVSWGAIAGNSQIDNSAIVDFGNADGAPAGPVSHFATYDAPTAGNQIMNGPLTNPKTINAGDPVSFPVGTLSKSIS